MVSRSPTNAEPAIVEACAWLCELPVLARRVDATQTFTAQETIFVRLTTADGQVGTGFAYTIGTGGRATLAHLERDLLPQVIGLDSRRCQLRVSDVWHPSGRTRALAGTSEIVWPATPMTTAFGEP